MPNNEKEYDGYLFDQLTILERLERIAKKSDNKEIMEEIAIIRKEIERKLYRPGSKSEQGAVKIFTNVIRKILKDCEDEGKKVTQVELAKVLGISRQAFTNKLTRDSFFIDDVVKIANYLGMQVVLKGSNEYVIEKED